jgi:hypothetical protein
VLFVCTALVATAVDPGVTIDTPDETIIACVGDHLMFTCTTRGYAIGHWTSNEYINGKGSGHQLAFGRQRLHEIQNSTVKGSDASATLIEAYDENGLTVLVIKLQCTVSVGSVFICGGDSRPETEKNVTVVLGETKYALYLVHLTCTSYCRTRLYSDNWHAH